MTYYWFDKDKNIYKITLMEWAEKFKTENYHVKNTFLKKYDVQISTVFLGLDHGPLSWASRVENYRPILFETMIFWEGNNDIDLYQQRYSTWKEAAQGHRDAVRLVINNIIGSHEK